VARKEKTKKRPLRRRIRDRLRAAGDAGTEAVRNPRSIPGTAEGFFRRWFRKLWQLRGGGLYAVGYAATFIWLEIATLFGEIFGAESVQQFVSSQVFEFFFRFLSESIANMVTAFMWPVFFIGYRPPLGIFVLVAAFLLFPHFVKPLIEKWLLRDEDPSPRSPE
jgi:hypothetical protein